ncbi:hypothetical protein HaLaN_20014 [Haematococcus lacustris]|uniref:Uncharacterized protein n=1 Tax=Haematococcus lacustris TaxID=44745 RepID=A0A699ZUY1_HAELA|nr:hypothetical protein HaLaN_20014 [Haematococcus lacustris]
MHQEQSRTHCCNARSACEGWVALLATVRVSQTAKCYVVGSAGAGPSSSPPGALLHWCTSTGCMKGEVQGSNPITCSPIFIPHSNFRYSSFSSSQLSFTTSCERAPTHITADAAG